MNAIARNILSNINVWVALEGEVGHVRVSTVADKLNIDATLIWDALRSAEASRVIYRDAKFGTFKATHVDRDRRYAYQSEASLLAEKGFATWSKGWLAVLNNHIKAATACRMAA